MAAPAVERRTVEVDGIPLSYLTTGDETAPPLILLHGTFWSRVWQPVLPALATHSRCYAIDFPGFGRSGGELNVEQGTVPALAQTVLQAADALGIAQFDVAAHDIGGGVAQQLAATSGRIRKMVLMNAVMFDSWPVPAVERFRDPAVRRNTTEEDLLAARRKSTQACALRTLSEDELEDYLSPWQSPARARSWMAMAAAADARYTLDLVPALKEAAIPTRLVWGRDDDFQKIEFAHRYVKEIPNADLVEVDGKHIPTEDSPGAVAAAMLDHLANGQ
ncbi:pimeloyl-ACP methyl ester carboxylesterase [Arthrobacter sp. SLBN-112]|uniref:alpha/beta fold hydrolase n=1 Tax=Arthrobacter sp. SLBN-112 TaxID=2768452 RepID=UPI0011544A56|nr:alpha/beta hydrolase [Arthrobacter sp. SLBN-112]TQJ38156.1 pimeloyl-ACP methyl ester carboxylesterase [Arthrobacter sp. SLBN-112]